MLLPPRCPADEYGAHPHVGADKLIGLVAKLNVQARACFRRHGVICLILHRVRAAKDHRGILNNAVAIASSTNLSGALPKT